MIIGFVSYECNLKNFRGIVAKFVESVLKYLVAWTGIVLECFFIIMFNVS